MKTDQIAAQLYTCRDLLKTPEDIAKTLKRVRAAGYTAVQLSGLGPIETPELKRILDGEGLIPCATHEDGNTIRKETEKVIAFLKEIGCSLTAYPWPAGVKMDDLASLESLIADLEAAAVKMAAEGIILTYHNHGIEFVKIGAITALDRIFDNAKTVQGEPDTYWIHYGGGDVVAWCRKLSGRLPMIHLKDYAFTVEGYPTFCEVGSGTLDFKAIVAAAEESGCRWFIVEQDITPGDPVDSLKQSYEYLAENVCQG